MVAVATMASAGLAVGFTVSGERKGLVGGCRFRLPLCV